MLKEHLRFVITEDVLLLIPIMSSQVRRYKKDLVLEMICDLST